MKKYKGTREKIALSKLMAADPDAYAGLCEKAGYLSTALYYHSRQRNEKSLEHALEIAGKLHGVPEKTITSLLMSLEKEYVRMVNLSSFATGRGSEGDLYVHKEKLAKLGGIAAIFGLVKLGDLYFPKHVAMKRKPVKIKK